jgi:hypothetical protein
MDNATGVWRCGNGLELSISLGGKLADQYAASFRPGRHASFPVKIGVYYCPGCSTQLDAAMTCTDCGKSLRPFLYELVELHPHPPYRTR